MNPGPTVNESRAPTGAVGFAAGGGRRRDACPTRSRADGERPSHLQRVRVAHERVAPVRERDLERLLPDGGDVGADVDPRAAQMEVVLLRPVVDLDLELAGLDARDGIPLRVAERDREAGPDRPEEGRRRGGGDRDARDGEGDEARGHDDGGPSSSTVLYAGRAAIGFRLVTRGAPRRIARRAPRRSGREARRPPRRSASATATGRRDGARPTCVRHPPARHGRRRTGRASRSSGPAASCAAATSAPTSTSSPTATAMSCRLAGYVITSS